VIRALSESSRCGSAIGGFDSDNLNQSYLCHLTVDFFKGYGVLTVMRKSPSRHKTSHTQTESRRPIHVVFPKRKKQEERCRTKDEGEVAGFQVKGATV
jgi:hypothetical protein